MHRRLRLTSDTDITADVYARAKKISHDYILNTYATLCYFAPTSLAMVFDSQNALNSGDLRNLEYEIIQLLVSEKTGCDVHNLWDRMGNRPALALWRKQRCFVFDSIPCLERLMFKHFFNAKLHN